MVIQTGIPKFQSLEWMRSNSVIFVCGALTFLYIVELSLGIRIVCFACQHWKQSRISEPYSNHESWNIGIASILIAVLAAGLVNLLSVYWEHRKNDENERLSRVRITRHVLHALIGGILWRYIALWRAVDVKKEAVLLTSAKFLFTQFYTVPLVIIHISISTDLSDAMFDVALIISATVTILLACIVFKDGIEMQDQSSFCETMMLVPLIFRQPTQNQTEEHKENEEDNNIAAHQTGDKKTWAICLLRIVVSVQIFFFTYGRLLALGFLLKMARIYAVTILFLQILISALYLKFQAPYIFVETQQKHKQLMRLAFLSYTLVFELHLHREKDTGYNLGTKIRQGMVYYCTTTIESVFYITMWAVTEGDDVSTEHFPNDTEKGYQTKTIILLVGYLSLVNSAVIHIFLALLRSYKKVEVFSRIKHIRDVTFDAVRRRMSRASVQQSSPAVHPASFVDIASFTKNPARCEITLPKLHANDPSKLCDNELSNSYYDFKDRIDDHVHAEPKEHNCNSEANKKRQNSNAPRKQNVDSSPSNSSSFDETKSAKGQRSVSSRHVNEKIVGKQEVRNQSNASPKITTGVNTGSTKSCTTPKHLGAITRLWEKYSKFSSKQFSKLGSRFRNLQSQNTNEIQKTSYSDSTGKVTSREKTKTTIGTALSEETMKKSSVNRGLNLDATRVKQNSKKTQNAPRRPSPSPEISRPNWKKENRRNPSETSEKRLSERSRSHVVSPEMKPNMNQVKSYRNLKGKSNVRSEDEEDDIFVKGSIPKILITPDQTESAQKISFETHTRTDCAKERKDAKPRSSKQRRGSQQKEK